MNNNPVVKIYKSEVDKLGTADKFPYVAITHRLTEHYHYFTKFMYGPSRAMPHMFVEIPEELAKEKGISNGDVIKISSARGSIKALAMPTKRIKPLMCDGKKIYNIGIPIHWGYEGLVTGGLANMLTPFIWDPNANTPEYKGFLCNIEKAGGES
jgi:formate dehydrogenase major subunit